LTTSNQCAPIASVAKVILDQFLHELREVEVFGSGRFGLLDSDGLSTAATNVEAWLLGLARGFVYNVSLKNAAGLHCSHTSEDLQHLIMA
jgi:hypothetical protein